MMKKIYTLIMAVVFLMPLQAQMIERSLMSSAGGSFTTESVSGYFAIGELAVTTLKTDDFIFAQGFVQPEVLAQSTIDLSNVSDQKISVYPNPAINYVNVKFNDVEVVNVVVRMIDVTGKLRLENKYELESSNSEIQLDLKELGKGIYFISVYQDENLLKRAKIYKK